MAEVPSDVRPPVEVEVGETVERKAQILDAMRDAEMCVLQYIGRDKNPYKSTGDIELEDVWEHTWNLHSELRGLRSSVVCLQEITRRMELRAKGSKR